MPVVKFEVGQLIKLAQTAPPTTIFTPRDRFVVLQVLPGQATSDGVQTWDYVVSGGIAIHGRHFVAAEERAPVSNVDERFVATRNAISLLSDIVERQVLGTANALLALHERIAALEAAKPPAKPFEITEPGTYKRRDGEEVVIVERNCKHSHALKHGYEWLSLTGGLWQSDGHYWADRQQCDDDIVERLS